MPLRTSLLLQRRASCIDWTSTVFLPAVLKRARASTLAFLWQKGCRASGHLLFGKATCALRPCRAVCLVCSFPLSLPLFLTPSLPLSLSTIVNFYRQTASSRPSEACPNFVGEYKAVWTIPSSLSPPLRTFLSFSLALCFSSPTNVVCAADATSASSPVSSLLLIFLASPWNLKSKPGDSFLRGRRGAG